MRVFLIEDDAMILRALERMLRPLFAELRSFADPHSAMDEAAKSPPDLVISDYSLPQVDGIDVLAAVRAANPRVRTVLLSGNIPDDRIDAGVRDGLVDRFMTKPWSHDALIEVISALAA